MKTARYLALSLISATLCGCGASQSTGPNIPQGAGEGIADTHALILESTYGGSPLKSAKDLEQYKDRFAKAVEAVKSGEVKIIYGKPILDNVQTPEVIAYESKAESGEGFAVKNNGKIEKITAADLPKSK